MSALHVPLTAAKVARRVLAEKARPPRAVSAQQIPVGADAITDVWLTDVLCRDVPGARVDGLEVHGGSDGTSSRRALSVSYNEAGRAAGLPEDLFVKAAASLQSRLFLVLGGVTQCETTFYRDIRPELEHLRSPRAYHAASDARRFRSIVVLEDLSAQGWTFPDPMSESMTRQDAEDMVDVMAYYHAAFWGSDRLEREFGLPTTYDFQHRLNSIGIAKRAVIGVDRARDVLPPGLVARKREVVPATMRALRMNSDGVQTLLHQDVHQGNWMRDSAGRVGLYDWQATARGGWALDFSYAMSVNLDVEDRRLWERDLLERYLGRLTDEGVVASPTFAEAWLMYRQQPFHVLIFALFTIGSGRLQPDMQPKDYMLRCLQRIGAFVDDHESLDALGARAPSR